MENAEVIVDTGSVEIDTNSKKAKNSKWITAFIVLFVAVILVIAGTLAWFYNGRNINMDKVNGSLEYVQPYFESGTGTSDDPYIIKTAEQFYNFAWLQYIGAFNQDSDSDGAIDQVYFKLDADIDLSDKTLPPVGTSTYPFVGNFDGNGKTITGAVVSSNIDSSLVPDLAKAAYETYNTANGDDQIVGLFGVVGSLSAAADPSSESAESTSITSGGSDYTYNCITNEIKNLNIVSAAISANASKALIGIAAGYVNGTMSGVAISSSTANVTNSSALATDYTAAYSNYTTVGYCTAAYENESQTVQVDVENPTVELSKKSAEDQGDAWGGSINMVDLHSRLVNVYGAGSTSSYKYYGTQTITINEVTGAVTVENGTLYSTTANNAYSSIRSGYTMYAYPSDVAGGEEGSGGNAVLNPQSNDQFIGMMGRPTDLSGVVTVNRLLNDFRDAYYIVDGTSYLNIDTSSTTPAISSVLTQDTKWVVEVSDTAGAYHVYALVNGTKYYLQNNSGTLGVGETEDTSWTIDNDTLYSTAGTAKYYLNCNGGSWGLSTSVYCYLTDTLTEKTTVDYLTLDSSGNVDNVTSEDSATRWLYNDTEKSISTETSGGTVYLGVASDEYGNYLTTSDTLSTHFAYSSELGVYTYTEDSGSVASWQTNGTILNGSPVTEDCYVLETGNIKTGVPYAIVSRASGSTYVMTNTSGANTVGSTTGTVSNNSMTSGTILTMNTGTYSDNQQLWTFDGDAESGYTIMGNASYTFLNLAQTTVSTQGGGPGGGQKTYTGSSLAGAPSYLTVSNVDGETSKKISYTQPKTSDYTLRYSNRNDYLTTDLYYLGDSGYEKITSITTKQTSYSWFNPTYRWTVVTTEGTYTAADSANSITVVQLSSTENITNYVGNVSSRGGGPGGPGGQSTNYFYTTDNTDENDELYFFKLVKEGESYNYTLQTEYLQNFITYATNLLNSKPSSDPTGVWANLEAILQQAQEILDNAPSGDIDDYDTARYWQYDCINPAAVALQQAILAIEGSKYFVCYDSGWTVYSEADASSDIRGTLQAAVNRLEDAGQVQMVSTETRGVGLPTYVPLNAESSATFDAKSANTGYICSANSSSSQQPYSGDIRVSWFNMSDLGHSLNTTSSSYTYTTSSNMQVLTRTASSDGIKRINYACPSGETDDGTKGYNNVNSCSSYLSGYSAMTVDDLGLEKFAEARKNLQTALLANPTKVYGIHFMDALISESTTFFAPTAVINGQTYTNYEMPEACIDFQLKEKGYINFFSGTYYNNSTTQYNSSFFALYEIERNGSAIESIKEISKIYGDTSKPAAKYVYEYSDGSWSGTCPTSYTEIFDTDWIKYPGLTYNGNLSDSLFYYEIPTNAGEYALGSVDGKLGAYLIYLDISANKQEVKDQKIKELTTTTTSTYKYPKGVQLVESGSYTSDADGAAAVITAGTPVSASLSRSGSTITATGVKTLTYLADGLTAVDGSGKTLYATTNTYQVDKKYTITTFDTNTSTLVTTETQEVFTTTSINGGTPTRSYAKYVDGVEQEGAEDPGTAIPSSTTSNIYTSYHYVLPAGTTVTTTSQPTNLTSTGLDNVDDSDYPAIGETAVTKTDLVTSYAITITPTNALNLTVDKLRTDCVDVINGTTVAVSDIPKKMTITAG